MSVPLSRVGIIDTDALLDDLVAHATEPVRGSLFTRRTGSTRWIASAHVFYEIYQSDKLGNRDKFDKIAHQSVGKPWQTSAAELRDAFETLYLSAISFVDVEGVMDTHPFAVSVANRDPKDKPTGQLAALMEATGFLVFSRDHSLKEPGLAPSDIVPVLKSEKTLRDAEEIVPTAVAVGQVTVLLLKATASSAATRLRTPTIAGWGLLATIALVAMSNSKRRSTARSGVAAVASVLAETMTIGESARLNLAAVFVDPASVVPLECHIAGVLALAARPLLVREIRELLNRTAELEPRPSDRQIREALRALPCFTEPFRHRWQLGETRRAPDPSSATAARSTAPENALA